MDYYYAEISWLGYWYVKRGVGSKKWGDGIRFLFFYIYDVRERKGENGGGVGSTGR